MDLRDVTVGVDERLRRPLEVCVDPQHPGSIALSRSQKVQVLLFDTVRSKWGTLWLAETGASGRRRCGHTAQMRSEESVHYCLDIADLTEVAELITGAHSELIHRL